MSEQGHKIPVEVIFETTGAEEAKRAVQDVANSGDGGSGSILPGGAGGGVAAEIAAMKEKEAAARRYNMELESGQRIEAESARISGQRTSAVLRGLGTAGIAGAAGMAAKTLGEVWSQLETIDTKELRKIDGAMADQVEGAKKWAQALSDPIGALVSWVNGESIGEAFAAVNEAVAKAAQAQKEQIDRLINTGIKTTEELRRMAQEISDANAILDAKDAADSKARDRADAAAIRDGADPREVAKKRARDDAQIQIDAINRDLDGKAQMVQELFENSRGATANRQNLENVPTATKEDLEKAREAEKARLAEFEEAKRQFERDKAIAEQQRRGVREGAAGRVEDLTGEQQAEAKRKADEAKRMADEAARKAREEAAKDAAESARNELRDTARGNSNRVAKGGNRNPTLQGIGKDLGSADTAEEIEAAKAEILASSGELGERVVAALLAMAEKQRQLVERVANAEAQIKQARVNR